MDAGDLYFGHGSPEPMDEAIQLALHCLGIPFARLEECLDRPVGGNVVRRLQQLLEIRCRTRKPMAYLICKSWFAGLEFYVDERVLVPRSPIAELVEKRFSPWLTGDVRRILDLGTGSACIAVACAEAFPEASVDAIDSSSSALMVAAHNCSIHEAGRRVRLYRSDLFKAVAGKRYDLIVSNPPYVEARELIDLPREYHYEPRCGLQGGGDGLSVTRRILRGAARHLTDSGVLIGEVGSYAALLAATVPDLPFVWVNLERGGEGVFVLFASDLRDTAGAL